MIARLRLSVSSNIVRLGVIEASSSPIPQIRARALQIMGSSEGDVFVHILINSIHDKDLGVQIAAVTSLGNMRGDNVVQALRLAMSLDEVALIGAAAASLVRYAGPKAEAVLIDNLQSPSSVRILAAAAALGEMRSKRAVEPLRQCSNHPDELVRVAVTAVLEELLSTP